MCHNIMLLLQNVTGTSTGSGMLLKHRNEIAFAYATGIYSCFLNVSLLKKSNIIIKEVKKKVIVFKNPNLLQHYFYILTRLVKLKLDLSSSVHGNILRHPHYHKQQENTRQHKIIYSLYTIIYRDLYTWLVKPFLTYTYF